MVYFSNMIWWFFFLVIYPVSGFFPDFSGFSSNLQISSQNRCFTSLKIWYDDFRFQKFIRFSRFFPDFFRIFIKSSDFFTKWMVYFWNIIWGFPFLEMYPDFSGFSKIIPGFFRSQHFISHPKRRKNCLNWRIGGHFPTNQAVEAKKCPPLAPRDPIMSRYYHVKLVSELKNDFPHVVVAIISLLLRPQLLHGSWLKIIYFV